MQTKIFTDQTPISRSGELVQTELESINEGRSGDTACVCGVVGACLPAGKDTGCVPSACNISAGPGFVRFQRFLSPSSASRTERSDASKTFTTSKTIAVA